ncbi:helix-turn-helix transcriptional regulator [Nonomuraea sp. PA05]|uniref:helix-turn-helix domain-containing protein n=1 Tax=Nonomuraea sp. PA05 TaxID=2604466 RepID=UPI0011D7073B|nr:helix-turn-helix transcriptional regulator [Nonomuraea sp. PA05]TYB63285.1 helix-turn-helix transcriptional regulator [Nonomuraea sp. PA05]
MGSDPWTTTRAAGFLSTRDVGSALRYARTLLGLRQADVGRAAYCSASTISRLETGRHGADLDLIRRVATAVAIPPHVLAALTGLGPPARATVTSPTTAEREDDPMRRRTLFTAAATAVPAALLARIEDALAVIPSAPARPLTLTARLAHATRLFDRGELAPLVADLPDLLAVAHENTEQERTPDAFIRAAACYGLATEALSKAGRQASSRLAADRAVMFARLSGSPTSVALAARCLGVVLRHEGRHALADQVVLESAGHLEATGLTRASELAVYGQVLCSAAYTAAQHGDRARALELIREAAAAVRRLPRPLPAALPGQPPVITPAQVRLYEIGVHWSLGDPATALRVGRTLTASQFATPERRARLHTDLARVCWQQERPERTIAQLLAAYQHARGEVSHRFSIRQIAVEVTDRFPRASGAVRLRTAIGHGPDAVT